VLRVIDGANLECDADTVERRLDAGQVLVAVDGGRVVGALVAAPAPSGVDDESAADPDADGAHVEAVAVRLRRRGQGIGTDLLRAAGERWRPLTADFYPGLSGFYEKLDFDIEKREGQFRGVLE
jgi:GNAT superfamily N-acetyltransferase